MKSLSRILMICLCSAPIIHGAWGVVATNSGSNLTSFTPSNAYNNQWATISNGRNDVSLTPAKANFGNCNSLILRCAQPKCGNGGCTDMNVAAAIVAGCVQSNKSCEKYGDDLVSYMSAQLVASSNAKVNAQNAAAAQAANAAQQEQMTAMQAQMQQQMAAMQQQMAQQSAQIAQQNEQTQQQIQAALDAQAQQNQAALNNMASAATTAAQQQQQTSGLTAYQEEAVARGVSDDILARQTITGQIMTSIEDAQLALKDVKTAMADAFEYAGCDTRGNNCEGPKRVKKFRERALNFIDPYDTVIDKIYDALIDAQTVGVNLSDIYLMLNDSCNRWGRYMCPEGTVVYDDTEKGQRGAPSVCDNTIYTPCLTGCITQFNIDKNAGNLLVCKATCKATSVCKPCTLLDLYTSGDDVYIGWINAETTSTENQTVVACASSALDDSYIGRRSRRKRGVGLGVDIDQLERWLSQVEPKSKPKSGDSEFLEYCGVEPGGDEEADLRKSALSKTIVKSRNLCVDPRGSNTKPASDDECPYINKVFALCDTHLYNANHTDHKDLKTDSSLRPAMKEIIGLKTTVIAQQMYKQYEFLAATLRRLQVQLEKSVLTANIQAAGGFSGGGSSSGGGSGSTNFVDDDKNVVLNGATNCSGLIEFDQFVSCLQSNVSLIKTYASNNPQNACKQLQYTLEQAKNRFAVEGYDAGANDMTPWVACADGKGDYIGKGGEKTCKGSKKKQDIINCSDEIISRAGVVKRKIDESKRRYRY